MKHHHCGFSERHHLSNGKRLGILGATLMILHVLYHVVELLILPAIFVAWSGHHAAPAVAEAVTVVDEAAETEPEASESDEAKRPFSTLLYTDFFETLH